MEGENRLYTVLAVAGGFFCLAAALLFGSAPAAAVSAAFFFLSLAAWKYGYFLVPALMRGSTIAEAGRNFEIPPSQDVVVGREGGRFLATAYLSAQLYESAAEKDESGRAAMSAMFERAITSAGFPFRVCAQVSPIDLKTEVEEMRSRRSIAESRREKLSSQRGGQSAEFARLEREIAMWSRQIEKLGGGEKPLEVAFYLSTTASGTTKEEAIAGAHRQASELSVVVGSALSCEVRPLAGEEMRHCFWWDFFGPENGERLRDEMF